MGEYLISLVSVASLASLAGLLSYSGGEDKSHKFAISVILLYTAAMPIFAFLEGVSEFDVSDFTEILPGDFEGGAYEEVTEEAFEEGIRRLVAEKWDIDEEKIAVSVSGFDFESMRAEKIKITLMGKGATVDFRAVAEYIEKRGLGSCEVGYAF